MAGYAFDQGRRSGGATKLPHRKVGGVLAASTPLRDLRPPITHQRTSDPHLVPALARRSYYYHSSAYQLAAINIALFSFSVAA